LPGWRVADLEFACEMAGAGAAGTVPAYDRLLRACGMARSVFAASRVEYTPISDAPESASFQVFYDGIRYAMRGARGNVQFDLTAGQTPKMRFKFTGFDHAAAEIALGSPTYSTWQAPDVIVDTNTADVTFGGTLTTGNIAGGTAFPSLGLTLDLGHTVEHVPMLGGERIALTARKTTGSCQLGLTAAQESTWRTDVNAVTMTTFGFQIGAAAGRRVRVWSPSVQRVNPQQEDMQGYLMIRTDLAFTPGASGNDELRIIVA
jgi:hypothetical protein